MAPPSGTLTFLFTDIEGSTRLWETHPEAMRLAVARHDQLLRQSIAARSGYVFKTGGDAFCAAFASAAEAIAAALSAQQAVHAERWPEGLEIRVRMALHTGAAELRDGDYFGPPLNYVARLLATGHGAQTLVSEITQGLSREHLPVGASLKPLGVHSLKDVAGGAAVFQLSHAGLPASFPPLQASAPSPPLAALPSIAVLPFINLSRDEENEYFADGLAEELLNVLAKIPGLRVVSRSSAFSFKGSQVDVPTIARKLNVATVLEGSVRKAGSRVRVTAQLVQAATDSHLWSDSYDRNLEDIFALQDDIAQSVVKELRSKLLGAGSDVAAKVDVQAATKGRGESAEAHRLYLQAQFFLQRTTEPDTAKAIDYFQRALELDPDYALAWAGLAGACINQAGFYAQEGVGEHYEKARTAALRALALEPELAEAHLQLGRVQLGHDWDWASADASHRRALELAPGNVLVLRGAARLALNRGQPEEAIVLLRQATQIDPLNAPLHRSLALANLVAGDMAAAELAAAKGIELSPTGGFGHGTLGEILMHQGRVDEALAEIEQESNDVFRLQDLAMVQNARNRTRESSTALQQLIDRSAGVAAYQIAEAYAFCGNADAAFEWLDRAFRQRDPGMASMKNSVPLRKVHGDPRWRSVLAKMNLAD